ncbi:MAG: hypothetical protein FWG87_03780 [Defluviitaleaceae bacterium]|nr:hypothetical protein [Defluviitaleaceae bacterium]
MEKNGWGGGTHLALIMAVLMLLSPISGLAATPEVIHIEIENELSGMSEFVTEPMVSSGEAHTVALKSDGTVWAWGSNASGQLGTGTTANSSTPVQVTDLADVIAVSAARGQYTVAVKADGTVWAWGNNDAGQLGDGTTIRKTTPVQVVDLTGVVAVSAGNGHTVALKADGTVWAWGNNGNGQLGDGTTTTSYTPVQVKGLTGVIAISTGSGFTVALKADGTVWAWGSNNSGQLGDGTPTQRHEPVQATAVSGVTVVSAGSGFTVASKSDGTVWASNQVVGLTDVTTVSAGREYAVALKSDGTAWAWGRNYYGEHGNGATGTSTTPVQVVDLTGFTAVSAGTVHTVALKADGTVWGWGYNNSGQLGNGGTAVNNTTPVQTLGEGGEGFLNLRATVIENPPEDLYTVVFNLNGGNHIGGGEIQQAVSPSGTATTPIVAYSGWVLDRWDISFANINKNIVEMTAQWLRLGAISTMGVSVSSADVVWLARHVAGHEGFELDAQGERLVDMNGDGVVDSADITVLMRWLVGWELEELQG